MNQKLIFVHNQEFAHHLCYSQAGVRDTKVRNHSSIMSPSLALSSCAWGWGGGDRADERVQDKWKMCQLPCQEDLQLSFIRLYLLTFFQRKSILTVSFFISGSFPSPDACHFAPVTTFWHIALLFICLLVLAPLSSLKARTIFYVIWYHRAQQKLK